MGNKTSISRNDLFTIEELKKENTCYSSAPPLNILKFLYKMYKKF